MGIWIRVISRDGEKDVFGIYFLEGELIGFVSDLDMEDESKVGN